jgi:hypothetical protein
MSRPGLVVMLVVCSFATACCDRETKRIQPHWLRTTEGYLLKTSQIEPQQVRIIKRDVVDTSFESSGITGVIGAQHYGFWLDLTNKNGESIRLLWPEARYVDELGKAHTVYAEQRGALPDERDKLQPPPVEFIEAGGRSRPTVVPVYKQYLVASGCRNLYPYSEPLIPTRLDDKNEQQMKAYVDDLARRQVPVKLFLPIEIDGERYDYTFTFVLKGH